MRMYFAGVDLAWGGRNPTGIAVLDLDGRLVHIGAVRDDAAVLATAIRMVSTHITPEHRDAARAALKRGIGNVDVESR